MKRSLIGPKKLRNIETLVKRLIKNNIPGVFWECGVYNGGSADLIFSLLPFSSKLYLFDSFEGLPKPHENDNYHKEGDFSDVNYDLIKKQFGHVNNVQIVKGWIPESFSQVPNEAIAFCHIDLDLYEGYKSTLELVWPRLSKGGVIVLDDYDWHKTKSARISTDEFFSAHNLKVIDNHYIIK